MSDEPVVRNRCPLCGGRVGPGHTTFTADTETCVIVVRHVPASVCAQCGESWLDDETAGNLKRTVNEARARRHQVDVLAYTP